MDPVRIAKIATGAHVALVVAAVYFVTQIWNYTPLQQMPSKDSMSFAMGAISPLLALGIGLPLARGQKAHRLLAGGLIVAMLLYAAAFFTVVVTGREESLAPLLILLTSLWIALGLAGLVIAVWFVGRKLPRT